MSRLVLLAVVVTTFVIGCIAAESLQPEEETVLEVEDGYRARRAIAVPHCKQLNEGCRGVPRCCDRLHCYWVNGYNPLQDGSCVTCIDRNLKCQRNVQCCNSLVCQKSTRYQVDGICDVKRPLNGECHNDDMCESSHCSMTWFQTFKGQGGTCTARP